jgi:hypothetical protein
VVHPFWPIRKLRRHARLSAKLHPYFIGPPQGPVIAIFALRGVGEPVTVTAKEVRAGSINFGNPQTTGNAIDDARTDEIGPSPAESARGPDDLSWLFDILPFFIVPPKPIRQD